MRIRIKQESSHKGRDWWDWAVWIDGNARALQQIESVKYTLHPTFPKPVRVMRNRHENFKIETSGWGEFPLLIEIRKTDGTVTKRKHWVRLQGPRRRSDRQCQVVFLSHSATDAPIAATLRKAMESMGLVVIDPGGLDIDETIEAYFGNPPNLVDAVLAVFSDAPSASVNNEVQLARNLRLPIVPVVLGSGSVPPLLRKEPTLVFKDQADAPGIAKETVERLRSILKR